MTGIEALKAWVSRNKSRKYMTNEWLYADDMKVYVRRGFHVIGGIQCNCLDIASVEVYKKGEGTFTSFLKTAIDINPWDAIYCECVQEERLCRFLERNGFTRQDESFWIKK